MTKRTDDLKTSLVCALIGMFTLIVSLSGCSQNSTTVTLSKEPVMLCDKPTVLKLEQPLCRKNKSLSIRMQLNETWTPEPPWQAIKLQDGQSVRLTAALISDKGDHYYPKAIGAGGGLEICFRDSVPKDAGIVKITLGCTYPLTAQNIVWVDWKPK